MKKILVTRRLLRSCEDKAKEIFDANLNLNDELYSQKKLIEMSEGCDGILSALTDKLDAETINQLPDSVKILSNFAVGFGNIDLEALSSHSLIKRLVIKTFFINPILKFQVLVRLCTSLKLQLYVI